MNANLETLEGTCLKLLRADKWQRAFAIASEISKIRSLLKSDSSFTSDFIEEAHSLSVRLIESHAYKEVFKMIKTLNTSFCFPVDKATFLSGLAKEFQEKGQPQLAKKCLSQAISFDQSRGCLLYTSPSPRDS